MSLSISAIYSRSQTAQSINNGKVLPNINPTINSPYSPISNCYLSYQTQTPLTYNGSVDSKGNLSYSCLKYGDKVTIKNYTGYVLQCTVNLDKSKEVTLQLPINSKHVTL